MTNKIKYIKIVFLIMIVGLTWSCSEKFLETEPSDAIPSDKIFESYVTAEAALTGTYDQLSAYTLEGLWVTLMSDIIGEDVMINSVDNWNWFVPVYQMNVLPNYTYPDNPWWSAYKVIFDANRLVAFAKDIPDATLEQKESIEGQGKVIRAYMMLKLAEMYAPAYSVDSEAPSIMNVNIPVDANSEDFGRAPLSEVYSQIVADLSSAIELLGESNYKGFFDKRAAQAILARTYLDMEEWAKARDMAKLAYEGVELMNVNELVYGGFYSSNSETIFSVAYTPDDNNTYMSIPAFYWPELGYSSMRANDEFVKQFSVSDARGLLFEIYEPIDPDRYLIFKFQHNAQVGNAERISIRASEMYLIEAECEAELGNYSLAQNALFVTQERSISGATKSSATGQDLINEILLERRKELFGEGFRWNDIKRRNLPFKREGDHWAKFDFGPEDDDYYRLTFPIPQSEIDVNTKINQLDQNIGY